METQSYPKCTLVYLHFSSSQSSFQFGFRNFKVKNGHVYWQDLHLNKNAEGWFRLFFFSEVETDGLKSYSVIAGDHYFKVSGASYLSMFLKFSEVTSHIIKRPWMNLMYGVTDVSKTVTESYRLNLSSWIRWLHVYKKRGYITSLLGIQWSDLRADLGQVSEKIWAQTHYIKSSFIFCNFANHFREICSEFVLHFCSLFNVFQA